MLSRLLMQHAGEKRSYRRPSGKVGSTNTHLSGCDLPEAELTTLCQKKLFMSQCRVALMQRLRYLLKRSLRSAFKGPRRVLLKEQSMKVSYCSNDTTNLPFSVQCVRECEKEREQNSKAEKSRKQKLAIHTIGHCKAQYYIPNQ